MIGMLKKDMGRRFSVTNLRAPFLYGLRCWKLWRPHCAYLRRTASKRANPRLYIGVALTPSVLLSTTSHTQFLTFKFLLWVKQTHDALYQSLIKGKYGTAYVFVWLVSMPYNFRCDCLINTKLAPLLYLKFYSRSCKTVISFMSRHYLKETYTKALVALWETQIRVTFSCWSLKGP